MAACSIEALTSLKLPAI